MATIQPFRAWRYTPSLTARIESLTSPLFDVISDAERRSLYANPLNSLHLSVPEGENPAEQAAQTLRQWKSEKIMVQDAQPAIYPYFQYFTLPGQPKTYCRKGFICHIKAHFWEEKQVLRHENTMPGSVGDRLELLEKTLLHSSPTHGLYRDESLELETFLDEALLAPLYETEDYQGGKDAVGCIQDAGVIKRFVEKIQKSQIILADGHHRYESSLQHRRRQMQVYPGYTGNEAWHFHLMYLTNTAANDLCILPTHRLIENLENFDENTFLNKLDNYFQIQPVSNPYTLDEAIGRKKWTFGLVLPGKSFKVRLKPEVFETLAWQFPEEIKRLDLTVLHYFVIEKALGIPGKMQRESPNLHFSRSLPECLEKVASGTAQLALITQAVTLEEVEQVCRSGYTMPQKSTYFYPKAVAGLVFSSIDEQENPPVCF
jgi:uncharacterized protein (DUF1015 family)